MLLRTYAPPQRKLECLSAMALGLSESAAPCATNDAWLHVRELASLACHARFMFLAVKHARLYLRELHNVVRTSQRLVERARQEGALTPT